MANVGNWVSERSLTVGTGNITLSGGYQGQVPFSKAFNAGDVYYSILDGANRECGTGSFDGTSQLIRSAITATYENGVYTDVAPTPISLTGSAVVSCTYNAAAFDAQAADAAAAQASQIAAANSAAAALVSENNASGSAQATAADVVLTHADVVTTNGDATTTNNNVTTTNGDVILTHADVQATNADVVSTNADVQTTHADVLTTNADAANTTALHLDFDKRNLGAKATEPTLDNQGQPLLDGAMFFDTTLNTMKVYDLGSTSWSSASATVINTISAEYVYTATASQTVFSGVDDNTVSMVINNSASSLVYLNGAKLIPNTDYTMVTGSSASITLAVGATAGDTLLVVAFNFLNNANLTAVSVANAPAGNIASLNLQDAINELDTEKEPADATILKNADIGTSVLAPTGDGTQLTGIGLGVGQTWQDVFASRASNVTYTNSTGKPIVVSVFVSGCTGGYWIVEGYVGGVLVAKQQVSASNACNEVSISFIVQDGETYKVDNAASNNPISVWMELR